MGWFKRKDDAPAREPAGETPDETPPRRRVFARLRERLSKTRRSLSDGLARVLTGKKINAAVLDQIEELLITSDIGVETATALIGRITAAGAATAEELQSVLREELLAILTRNTRPACELQHDKSGGWQFLHFYRHGIEYSGRGWYPGKFIRG